MINVTATLLGEGVFSLNANGKLSCSTLLIRSFHMPADAWYIVEPDQLLHKDLAESSIEQWTSKKDKDSEQHEDTMSPRVPMVKHGG